MHFEFDPTKDKENLAKHGVSLALAEELDWDAALVWVDARFEYNELRMIARAKDRRLVLRSFLGPRRGDASHRSSPSHTS